MNTARVDGGAILSGLRDYTIPLCDWRELAEARAECDAHIAVTERLKVALRIRGTGSYVKWAEYCRESVERAERAEAECERLRHAIDLAARVMGGEGVEDQGEAWDKCKEILDAARKP